MISFVFQSTLALVLASSLLIILILTFAEDIEVDQPDPVQHDQIESESSQQSVSSKESSGEEEEEEEEEERRASCVMKMGARGTTIVSVHAQEEDDDEEEAKSGSPPVISTGKRSGNYDKSSWEDEKGIVCDEDGAGGTTLFTIHVKEEKGEAESDSPTVMSTGKISDHYNGGTGKEEIEEVIVCDGDGGYRDSLFTVHVKGEEEKEKAGCGSPTMSTGTISGSYDKSLEEEDDKAILCDEIWG